MSDINDNMNNIKNSYENDRRSKKSKEKRLANIVKAIAAVAVEVATIDTNKLEAGACTGHCGGTCAGGCEAYCSDDCFQQCRGCSGCGRGCASGCRGCDRTCRGSCSGGCDNCGGACSTNCSGCSGCGGCDYGCSSCGSCDYGCSSCGGCDYGCSSTCSGSSYVDYTITLDRQGGTTGSTSVPGAARVNNAMPGITAPTRTGYKFDGYYSETDGKGTKYYKADGTSNMNMDNPSSTTINNKKTYTKTLYAKWNVVPYNVSYQTHGAKFRNGVVSHYKGEDIYKKGMRTKVPSFDVESEEIVLETPERKGMKFKEWKKK